MSGRRIEAVIRADDDNGVIVSAPAVGWFADGARVGEVLVGGSRVGRVRVLDQWVDVVLPAGTAGRVESRTVVHRREAVGFGEPLLRLVAVEGEGLEMAGPAAAASASSDLPEGAFAVTSPTHGMFYRRPKPEAPCYVEVGQVVEEGTTLALVEVMKCFSAIAYGGDGLPPRAEILEIRTADGVEVAADEVLFVVKAAG